MRVLQVAIVSIGFVILVGLLSQTKGQSTSQSIILKAPTAGQTATERSTRESEPHQYTNRIVGGIVSPGRPFIAALLYEKDGKRFQYCGASVIGDRWLLTAAHCEVQKDELAIVNRSNLGSAGGQLLRIVRVVPHPEYDSGTHNNDLALLYVSGDISSAIPRIHVVEPPPPGTKVLAAGWGLTSENGKPSLLLQEVEVPIVSYDDCQPKYNDLTRNMVCAGESGKDSCQGDSGGPLFLSGDAAQQAGIVSYGVGCGRKGYPGVYTQVDKYKSWIAKTMQ